MLHDLESHSPVLVPGVSSGVAWSLVEEVTSTQKRTLNECQCHPVPFENWVLENDGKPTDLI